MQGTKTNSQELRSCSHRDDSGCGVGSLVANDGQRRRSDVQTHFAMKKKTLIPILILAPLLLRAEITPYIVQTNGTTLTGTVPTNKVFVVQHVTLCNGSSSDNSIALMVSSSTGGFVRFYPQNEPVGPNEEVSVTLMKPLLHQDRLRRYGQSLLSLCV